MSRPKVLMIEDDESIRGLLVAAFRDEPLQVDTADDGMEALRLPHLSDYAVIVLDLMMPRLSGFDFLDAFHRALPNARPAIIIITAFDDAMLGRLTPGQVHAIVRKPFDILSFVAMIGEVARTHAGHGMLGNAVEVPPPTVTGRPN